MEAKHSSTNLKNIFLCSKIPPMVESPVIIDGIPGVRHLINEMCCHALQHLDPDNLQYPSLRTFLIEGMVPDEKLQDACDQINKIVRLKPFFEPHHLTFESEGIETHPLRVEQLLWQPVTGYVHPESQTGIFVPTLRYVQQYLLLSARKIVNRMHVYNTGTLTNSC